MEKMFVVWFCKGRGWTQSEDMTKTQAEEYALGLEENGYQIRIVPRLQLSVADIIAG